MNSTTTNESSTSKNSSNILIENRIQLRKHIIEFIKFVEVKDSINYDRIKSLSYGNLLN